MNRKIIVVYYSRSGKTKEAAEEAARNLGCDIEGITDNVDRSGIIGYLKSGKEAMKMTEVSINPMNHNVSDYDMVIIMTPVWAGTMASPVREFIKKNKSSIKAAAFVTTAGSDNPGKTFEHMRSLWEKEETAKVHISGKDMKTGGYKDKLKSIYDLVK